MLRRFLKIAAPALVAALLLCACSPAPAEPSATVSASGAAPSRSTAPAAPATPDPEQAKATVIGSVIDSMSMEQQVSQLFFVRLADEEGAPIENAAQAAEFAKNAQAGGYLLFADNITGAEETRALVDALQENTAIPPFVGIDEEGGRISRLGAAGYPGYQPPPAAMEIGQTGDPQNAYRAAQTIAQTLGEIGVNVDFAPVADVLTHPENEVIGDRSFGENPQSVSDMASAFLDGLRDGGVMGGAKHFPGHGGTEADTHTGAVQLSMGQQELEETNYTPFRRLVDEGVPFVMIGHFSVPEADKSGLPASLSPYFVTGELREKLGFDGIAITDSMDMRSITDSYSPAQAAVAAIIAGEDMVLDPQDYEAAKAGVLAAVQSGEIRPDRLRQSLERILSAKIDSGQSIA